MSPLANAAPAPSAAQLDDYAEQVVLLVRQSAAVQEARLDAFLDAAVLAAEQVQDVRLSLLEQPAEVSGWQFWGELALVFVLESNLVGKVLAKVGRKLFTPAVRSNALFLALPKSATGRELQALSRSVAGKVVVSGTVLTRGDVLTRGFGGLPGTATRDSVQLYHGAIQALARLGSDSGEDVLNAATKAVAQGVKSPKPRQNDPLPVTDSAGVTVLSAAYDYARATRLGIRVRHARIESFVRREASVRDLAVVVETLGWEPLDEQTEANVPLTLTDLCDRYRMLLEALIWARMYGFSVGNAAAPGSRDNPPLSTDPDQPFRDVSKPLQTYWRGRFQPAADAYAAAVLGEGVVAGALPDAIRLRKYFASLSTQLTKLGLRSGELTSAVPRAAVTSP